MKKNKRLSIRMNSNAIDEIKKVALLEKMTVHDLILARCCTPKDRLQVMKLEELQRYGEVKVDS